MTELQTLVGPDIVLTVIANKADLAAARAVPAAESRGAAAAVGASYFEVSALSGGARMRLVWAFTVFQVIQVGWGGGSCDVCMLETPSGNAVCLVVSFGRQHVSWCLV